MHLVQRVDWHRPLTAEGHDSLVVGHLHHFRLRRGSAGEHVGQRRRMRYDRGDRGRDVVARQAIAGR